MNDLDREARARVSELVRVWPDTLVVVSHDVGLLEQMDATAELSGRTLSVVGGPYSAWREHRDIEQEAALVESLVHRTPYRGAVFVVSHDDAFLARLRRDRRLELGSSGLTERAP